MANQAELTKNDEMLRTRRAAVNKQKRNQARKKYLKSLENKTASEWDLIASKLKARDNLSCREGGMRDLLKAY